jgi:hypothetical protein
VKNAKRIEQELTEETEKENGSLVRLLCYLLFPPLTYFLHSR